MQPLIQAPIHPGSLVRARGERWQVRDVRGPFGTATLITLEGAEDGNHRERRTFIAPFEPIDPVPARSAARGRRDVVTRGVLRAAGEARPARGLWAAASARMDILPWQLTPALAVVRGTSRLLLADAVGLGKTVQAGLVISELRARGLVDRALVLVPAGLRAQWADELRGRLDLPVRILDPHALLELGHLGPSGANPWSRASLVVSSIDLVKRADVRAAVESVPLDLLVVDEAHHATPGSDRHVLVRRLARQVPWVVLVTATPHSGDDAAYRALLELGAESARAVPMQVFRRSHADVTLQVPRRTRLVGVRPSAEEASLQAGVLAYARELCRHAASSGDGARIFASLLARRAASSPWAARCTLIRRLAWIDGRSSDRPLTVPTLPWEETDDGDADGEWQAGIAAWDPDAERRYLAALVERADAALSCWSKLTCLARLVRRLREPLVVFTEFRDTLEACCRALDAQTATVALHGGIEIVERQRRLQTFLQGGARVLVATDVAGEGLNLHRLARLVVTLEWPWNPLRLEQRIGRVHRLGQRRTVHAVHLTARGSYEEIVVARVAARAARAAAALSLPGDLVERQLAADLLGVPVAGPACPVAPPGAGAPDPPHALERAARDEAVRLERGRRWPPDARLRRAPQWTLPRRGAGGDHVIVVVSVVEFGSAGSARRSRVVGLQVTLRRAPATRAEWSRICRQLTTDGRVRQAAIDAPGEPEVGDQWAEVRARLAALRNRRRSTAPRGVQSSLFDRRAIREAEIGDAVRARWDDWQSSLQARMAAGALTAEASVLAVMPIEVRE